ncbi:unnamed protein product [Callosobruchus maculatus]|uniref:Uncharacterized protein n=1 Tax=Callosobruchus maculatus TaxID=64391 RepID=A0A653C6U6_CALMS|nr:unnamed protein product [Callosobruchus maculatus]
MPVKIFYVVAIIPLISAVPHHYDAVNLPYLEQVIPQGGPCKKYIDTFLDQNNQVISLINLPWDGSSICKLKATLVFQRLMPDKEAEAKMKMVRSNSDVALKGLLYELRYHNQRIIPMLTKLELNGRRLCYGESPKPLPDGPYDAGTTTLTLIHRTRNLGGD